MKTDAFNAGNTERFHNLLDKTLHERDALQDQLNMLRNDVGGLLMAVTSDACKRGVLVQMVIDGFIKSHPIITGFRKPSQEPPEPSANHL